ncbi:hypothetical protein [Litoribacter ruber]|uniref:hypothetical protein n=1 Tax=Litoribacter ruber TaxID=702568 RepID=UPI001FE56C16|nr:hypothetical protein [Litoribacter alkaliphilus]
MIKHLLKGFLALTILIAASACGSETPEPDQKTPEQLATEELADDGSATWTVAQGGSVTKDGANQTDLFNGFSITFNASGQSRTYSSSNGQGIFDASGNWSLAGSNLDRVILTGDQPASGEEIQFTRNQNNLRLSFSIPMPNARTNAVAGSYVFELTTE